MFIEKQYVGAITIVEVIDVAAFGTIVRQRRLASDECTHDRRAREYPEPHAACFICQTVRA